MKKKLFFLLLIYLVEAKQVCHKTDLGCECFDVITFSDTDNQQKPMSVDCNLCHITKSSKSDAGFNKISFKNCSKLESLVGVEVLTKPHDENITIVTSLTYLDDELFQQSLVRKAQSKLEIDKLEITGYISDDIPVTFYVYFEKLTSIIYEHNEMKNVQSDLFMNSESVRNVSLSSNKLEIIQKNLIRKLEHLKFLDLSHNQLSSIPDDFFINSKSLEYLVLSFNQISNISE